MPCCYSVHFSGRHKSKMHEKHLKRSKEFQFPDYHQSCIASVLAVCYTGESYPCFPCCPVAALSRLLGRPFNWPRPLSILCLLQAVQGRDNISQSANRRWTPHSMLTDILSSSLPTADLYLALIQLNKALRIFKHMLNNPI